MRGTLNPPTVMPICQRLCSNVTCSSYSSPSGLPQVPRANSSSLATCNTPGGNCAAQCCSPGVVILPVLKIYLWLHMFTWIIILYTFVFVFKFAYTVCSISTTDTLLADGNCTLGGSLVSGASCDVECVSGYSPASGSSTFTCATNGTVVATPTLKCEKATTCGAQVNVEFTCNTNTKLDVYKTCTLPGGCTSSFCCIPGMMMCLEKRNLDVVYRL